MTKPKADRIPDVDSITVAQENAITLADETAVEEGAVEGEVLAVDQWLVAGLEDDGVDA